MEDELKAAKAQLDILKAQSADQQDIADAEARVAMLEQASTPKKRKR